MCLIAEAQQVWTRFFFLNKSLLFDLKPLNCIHFTLYLLNKMFENALRHRSEEMQSVSEMEILYQKI